ncbi:MAG: hypothetical protein A4E20_18120 [Nitrospira sp. SG-bin2]|jgi:hypothetical protein|uniref:hypothetical protein n=1 Tax=Nitrospira cf. moscoviensis SBR1015 TaxID=96242 RepID=UPI000A0A4913|nr:hypothetical protein [Nitrospira cf. moscoviensis SBR1015]OQW36911.1 MAG: hypothetical protein A4E20_18120 [Nitrospira sp. SG-bin2]
MRTKQSQILFLFVVSVVISLFVTGSVAVASDSLCKTFRKLLRSSSQNELDQYQLFGTYGGGVELFKDLDIDKDGSNDVVEKGCPGSNEPSDPCMLSIKLSSSGESILFEAWGFRLIRYRAQVYIVANADEMRKQTNIFRIDRSGFELVCEKL